MEFEQQNNMYPKKNVVGRMMIIELRYVVMKDGNKRNNYNYTFDIGQNYKVKASSFKDYTNFFDKLVSVAYIEKPNTNNDNYPYRNIVSISEFVPPTNQFSTQQVRTMNVSNDLLANKKSVGNEQLEQEGITQVIPTTEEAEIMNYIVENVPLEDVNFFNFRDTMKQHISTVTDPRSMSLFKLFLERTKK